MPISSISESYIKYISSLVNKTAQSTDGTKSGNNADSNTTDTLELGSSVSDLSAYPNYDANGKYSNNLSLADFLSSEDSDTEDSDSLNMFSSAADSLTGDIFNSIADAKIDAINNLISDALSKKSSTEKEKQ